MLTGQQASQISLYSVLISAFVRSCTPQLISINICYVLSHSDLRQNLIRHYLGYTDS